MPRVLLCKGGDGPQCLTAPQVAAANKIYSSAFDSRTGDEIFPSLVPGTELGWGVLAAGPDPTANIFDHFKYVVFKNPEWDWRTFNFDSDIARSEQPENVVMNATDPNLRPFFAHNGKLLVYHGWADTNVATLNTLKYYHAVVDTLGGSSKTSDNMRLFLEPGMGHCGGGEGPNVFDKVGPLDQWVEQHKAPDKIIASHSTEGKVDRTRPLCPYPQVAKYKGKGSIDDAANFTCQAPVGGREQPMRTLPVWGGLQQFAASNRPTGRLPIGLPGRAAAALAFSARRSAPGSHRRPAGSGPAPARQVAAGYLHCGRLAYCLARADCDWLVVEIRPQSTEFVAFMFCQLRPIANPPGRAMLIFRPSKLARRWARPTSYPCRRRC